MKSKTIVYFLIVSMTLFVLCLGNREQPVPTTTQAQTVQTQQTAPPATQAANIPLSNLQIEACRSADTGGTCITKLKDFGIVSLEDCCKYLKKCCSK